MPKPTTGRVESAVEPRRVYGAEGEALADRCVHVYITISLIKRGLIVPPTHPSIHIYKAHTH